jgi:isopenicillin N synthase-like dioxygenase
MTMFEPISYRLWMRDKAGFADRLGQSFRETGFAVIKDHPIPDELISKNLSVTKSFFNLSDEAKRKYYKREWGGQRGYTPFGTEVAKGETSVDLKEFWHTGRELPRNSPYRAGMADTPSVTEIEEFDWITRTLYETFDQFGACILEAVAMHLGLPDDWFSNKVDMGNSILRLLHYPPQAKTPPPGSVRAAAHGDINVITLLLGAEEAGLQALHRSGEWLDINPPNGALVINCGDMLSRLTGGILPSTIHRVLNPTPERAKFPRYSYPFFLHFNSDVMIEALPQCLAEGGKAMPPISADDYLQERLIEIGLVKA